MRRVTMVLGSTLVAGCQLMLVFDPTQPDVMDAGAADASIEGAADAADDGDGGSAVDVASDSVVADATSSDCKGTFTGGAVFCDDFNGAGLGAWTNIDSDPANNVTVTASFDRNDGGSSLVSTLQRGAGCTYAQASKTFGASYTHTRLDYWVHLGGPTEFEDDFAVEQSITAVGGTSTERCALLLAFRYALGDAKYHPHLLGQTRGSVTADFVANTGGAIAIGQWAHIVSDVDFATGAIKIEVDGDTAYSNTLDLACGALASAVGRVATAAFGSSCVGPSGSGPSPTIIRFDDVLFEAE